MYTKTARITRRESIRHCFWAQKPQLPKRLFWEFRVQDINWRAASRLVIGRVMEWGNEAEWLEVIRYYGLAKVIDTLKKAPIYLPDHTISKVCEYFNLKKEELTCYIRKQTRRGHWI